MSLWRNIMKFFGHGCHTDSLAKFQAVSEEAKNAAVTLKSTVDKQEHKARNLAFISKVYAEKLEKVNVHNKDTLINMAKLIEYMDRGGEEDNAPNS